MATDTGYREYQPGDVIWESAWEGAIYVLTVTVDGRTLDMTGDDAAREYVVLAVLSGQLTEHEAGISVLGNAKPSYQLAASYAHCVTHRMRPIA